MSVPTSRHEFKNYCLRRLGHPVIEINVDDDQLEDRIDDALRYWHDYHFDGAEKLYYKHKITPQDMENKYITLPENIIGAVRIFSIGDALNTNNMFNIRYQIALNDLYTLTSVSMIPYYMAMSHIQFLEYMLVGQQPIRYNRHMNKLHIDMDWNKLQTDAFLLVEAYEVVDPDTFNDVWKDRWLLQYATALIKRQWGGNMKKYQGMTLPGGIQFNGQQIYNEADQEIQQLEKDMILNYSLPVTDLIGSFILGLISIGAALASFTSIMV
jgi:hypothetical protein